MRDHIFVKPHERIMLRYLPAPDQLLRGPMPARGQALALSLSEANQAQEASA